MDYGKMAQDMHDKVVSIRKDGGPGSGPRKGENGGKPLLKPPERMGKAHILLWNQATGKKQRERVKQNSPEYYKKLKKTGKSLGIKVK